MALKKKASEKSTKSAAKRTTKKVVLTGEGKNRFAIVVWMTKENKKELFARAKAAEISVVAVIRKALKLQQ